MINFTNKTLFFDDIRQIRTLHKYDLSIMLHYLIKQRC